MATITIIMGTAALIIIGLIVARYIKNKPATHIILPEFVVTPPAQNEPMDVPPVYIPPAQNTNQAETKNLLNKPGLPRGMRNNNPGNIRRGNNAWQGKIAYSQSTDSAFEQFSLYKWGVRAMIKLIINYINQGNNTITKIINKYAPSTENNTIAYINAVANQSGVNPNAILNKNEYELLKRIIIAMAKHENGKADAITEADFYTAWQLL